MSKSLVVSIVLAVFLILENFFPLRKRRDRIVRILHNFILSAIGLPISKLLTFPLILFIAYTTEAKGWGILNAHRISGTQKMIIEFLVLDYTLYWWHVANHKVPFFWRFHQVHHADRDMDSTTALRFHFGELVLSAFLRCGLILIVGIRIETVLLFDILVTTAAIFHHSNLKLPTVLEKLLSKLFVTPLFHQNHHSYYLEETDSNYSTIFNFWDRLHRSHTRFNKPEDIIIGHPAHSDNELKFSELIIMPFKSIKNWPVHLRKRT